MSRSVDGSSGFQARPTEGNSPEGSAQPLDPAEQAGETAAAAVAGTTAKPPRDARLWTNTFPATATTPAGGPPARNPSRPRDDDPPGPSPPTGDERLAQTYPIPPPPEPIPLLGGRLTAVDALRGLIMVIMVLDHTRGFFLSHHHDPMDVATTTVPLFFTRWVSHFCAPLFVFLAGTSAFLMQALGKLRSPGEAARFLATRGLLLIGMELTLVRLGWFFQWSLSGLILQVIYAIGMSMILLAVAVAVGLPSRWVGLGGALIVAGHNLLDPPGATIAGPGIAAGLPAPWSAVFTLLLRPGAVELAPGVTWAVAYPALPWFGVMALGYAFGEIVTRNRRQRVSLTLTLGAAAVAAFVLLRLQSGYGDPVQFQAQNTPAQTVMAFFNCQKYPPSLLFVLMTIGPGLIALAAFDATEGAIAHHGRRAGAVRRGLVTLGRVPLFFYLLQWPVIHLMAIAMAELSGQKIPWADGPFGYPPGYGYALPFVYIMWALNVAILYFPCRWYAELKLRKRGWAWLSYL